MTRYIYCQECGEEHEPHPLDIEDGWLHRKVKIDSMKRPNDLCIFIGDQKFPVAEMVCDRCNDSIPEGVTGYAMTMWRPEREGVPGRWEEEYGATLGKMPGMIRVLEEKEEESGFSA